MQRAGLRRASCAARTGVVTLVQRHGSAANLNVHLHMLVLDGVYEPIGERVRFHFVPAPSDAQVKHLLTTMIARILRRLLHDGWLTEDAEQPRLDLEPQNVIDEFAAASVRYRIAAGPGAGQRTLTLRSPALARPATPKPLTVNHQGFSINAAVACTAQQRSKLERIARYIARPAVALERLSVDHDGRVVLELKQPFRDGTTHMRFALADWPRTGWLGSPRWCPDRARISPVITACLHRTADCAPASCPQPLALPAANVGTGHVRRHPAP